MRIYAGVYLITDAPEQVSRMVSALREFIGTNQMMAYLVMMTARLIELHRVLKETGSLYLHCDPTASHYLKVVLDMIFGVKNFRNEIVWCYSRMAAKGQKQLSRCHDIIFWYSKTDEWVFNVDDIRLPYSEKSKARAGYKKTNLGGGSPKSEICELNGLGKFPEDWIQIPFIRGNEYLGYPTQKPLALLERIIKASSNEGDWILDPFAGCGTTIAAAEKLNRKWIGIDVTHLAIALLKYRLRDMKQDVEARKGANYEVIGEPKDLEGAKQLAQDDRYQFQWWANGLVEAKPFGGQEGSRKGKKGADKGIDGIINFIDDDSGKAKKVIVQVKSGKVGAKDIRDLVGTVDREKAAIGVYITLENPTKPMTQESVSAGHYKSEGWNKSYPKVQILTIEELMKGANIDMPPERRSFKKAKKEKKKGLNQAELL